MILKQDIFPIGQIIKPHGIHGEMSFTFSTDVFDREEIPFFIIEIDGIFVPFFIEEYRFKTDTSGLLKIEDVDTQEKAKEFAGLTIYLSVKYIEKVENEEIGLEYFVGYKLIDTNKGEIGKITEIDQTTENALFVIETTDDELLIPVSEEYIDKINHKKKIIYVTLPEGLLDL
ncbi:MAG TPA: ribosome maturation factor RimM [Paludibacter sp.]|nr:ribosome maturation factor RimM [Paludibacter sp.]